MLLSSPCVGVKHGPAQICRAAVPTRSRRVSRPVSTPTKLESITLAEFKHRSWRSICQAAGARQQASSSSSTLSLRCAALVKLSKGSPQGLYDMKLILVAVAVADAGSAAQTTAAAAPTKAVLYVTQLDASIKGDELATHFG